MSKELILASTSKYRQKLLSRLAYNFSVQAPLIDEEREKDLSLPPQKLAERLARLKAESLKGPGKVVIGGDQLVAFQGNILGKPGHRDQAVRQLMNLQGEAHELITAICVFDGDKMWPFTDVTRLHMKPLKLAQAQRYVDLDHPLDCAGAYKIEEHGIMLFDKIESEDFTAIQGLPLMALAKILENCDL